MSTNRRKADTHARNQKKKVWFLTQALLLTTKKEELLEFMQMQRKQNACIHTDGVKIKAGLDNSRIQFATVQNCPWMLFVSRWPAELESFTRDRYGSIRETHFLIYNGKGISKLSTWFFHVFSARAELVSVNSVEFSLLHSQPFFPSSCSKACSKYKAKWEVGNYPVNPGYVVRSTEL